jgi:hypothetical protein
MKTLKTFCAAAIVSLALAIPTFAGDIQTPTVVNPPPPPAESVLCDIGSPGEIQTPGLIDIFLALFSLL